MPSDSTLANRREILKLMLLTWVHNCVYDNIPLKKVSSLNTELEIDLENNVLKRLLARTRDLQLLCSYVQGVLFLRSLEVRRWVVRSTYLGVVGFRPNGGRVTHKWCTNSPRGDFVRLGIHPCMHAAR